MESKAEQAYSDIDRARVQSNWAALPDLIRRYKKYHPDEKVLPTTVLVEQELVQMLHGHKDQFAYHVAVPSSPKATIAHIHIDLSAPSHLFVDDGDHLPHYPPLTASQTQNMLTRLQDIIFKQFDAEHLETPDDWQAQLSKIVVARIYFESGRYKKALEALERLALRFEDVNWGYGLVLLIQARVIKGISLEMENRIPEALDAYDAAWEVMDNHFNEKNDHTAYWMEEALHRAILLRVYQNAPVKQTLKSLRCYHALAARHWAPAWQARRRWNIYCLYTQYLIKTHQDDTYVAMSYAAPPNESTVSFTPSNSGPASYQAHGSIVDELVDVLSHFRQLYHAMEPSLSRQLANASLLDLAHLIFLSHDVIGWGDLSNLRRVQQFLYRAKAKTFNSASITRLLFFTLVRLGEFDEAKHAFRSYMETVGLPDSDVPLDDAFDVADKVALIQRKLKIHASVGKDEKAAAIDENEATILEVLHAAVLMYARDFMDGHVATQLADIALELAREATDATIPSSLLATCYRIRGTAYGVRASQCDAPEQRAEYHGEAVHSLTKSVDLDNASAIGFYELAVQQAQMRDVVHALHNVSQALQRQPSHLPSWHLLALLSSCKQIHQYPKALQALEAGLKQVDLSSFQATMIGSMAMTSWRQDEPNFSRHVDLAEAYLSVRMTQIEMLEMLEGAEAVLASYTDLFATYGKLSQQLGLVYGELANAPGIDQGSKSSNASFIVDNLSIPPSSASTTPTRRLSVSSRSHQHLHPASAANMSQNGSVASTIVTAKPSHSEEIVSQRMAASERHQTPVYAASLPSTTKSKEKKKRGLIDMRLGRRIHSVSNADKHNASAQQLNATRTASQHDAASTDTSSKRVLDTKVSLASMVAPSFSSLTTLGRRNSEVSTTWSTLQPVQKENAFVRHQRERWDALMVKIWVTCTSSFIKAGRLDQAVHAIMEAEEIGLTDANVWHQLGVLCWHAYKLARDHATSSDNGATDDENPDALYDTAMDAFKKALAIDPDHIATHIDMATAFIEHTSAPQWELAEAMLERTTKSLGWDQQHAWYLLGRVYQQQNDMQRAKDCYMYALELSETSPIRSFALLPRFT
ncbi:hypothetical protein BC940DRAFT_310760 [Gongronella butleri]|nr:hypothetical protein BC940DRAFT_310760 [Gongronella butleri]